MNALRFKLSGALTDDHAALYIEREADSAVLSHLWTMDYLLLVEPRQQGKTSLVNHLMGQLSQTDLAVVYVDVTTPDRSSEASWYATLCPRILRQLRRFIPRDQWPPVPRNAAGWRNFLSDIAASAADAHGRVLIALDEIGAVDFPGATEFCSVLRDVYNSRQAEDEFKHLAFLLAGAFHPRDLIQDDRISPFNIAQRVRLADFTLARVRDLVSKGGWHAEQVGLLAERIHYWTDGQPYLTQLLCSYLGPDATPMDVDRAVERVRREDENNLPPLVGQLARDEQVRTYLGRIQAGEKLRFFPRENRRQAQLELLGVIKEDVDGFCCVRNRIYEQVLMVDSELANQPKAAVAIPARLPSPAIAELADLLGSLPQFTDAGGRGWRTLFQEAGLASYIGNFEFDGIPRDVAWTILSQLNHYRPLPERSEYQVLGIVLCQIYRRQDCPAHVAEVIKTTILGYGLAPSIPARL